MLDYMIETRTFVGQDGYAGFVKGRRYPLSYQLLAGEKVRIELDHIQVEMEPLVVSVARFETWWVATGKQNQQEEQAEEVGIQEEEQVVEED